MLTTEGGGASIILIGLCTAHKREIPDVQPVAVGRVAQGFKHCPDNEVA